MRALHLLDATAAARRRQPRRPVAALLLAVLAANGCADPVAETPSIPWTARLVRAEGDDPTLLRFFPRINGSVP